MNTISKCLCCDGELVPLINFGPMPLVNTYSVLKKFPLAVNRCISCCHLQLSEFVDPEVLYLDYTYCSGTGRTALEYFAAFARTAVSYFPQAKYVLDIASNDGSQLDAFKSLGLYTHGVDPAKNISRIAHDKGHNIRVSFFEETTFSHHDTFDIITAQNVIAHTPRPLEFLRNCAHVMHDKSRLFIATSQANLIVNGECDTIYHEHVSYFNAHSMVNLAARAGLIVVDIIMHDIHGTSYVFVLGKSGAPSERVADRMEWEFLVGLLPLPPFHSRPALLTNRPTLTAPLYQWWKRHVETKKFRINQLITDYAAQGYYMVGCGAAAKGLSMLNMAGVKLDLLADNTPTKIGRRASGMEIIPFNEIALLKKDKILFVVLAWNVGLEIRQNVLKLRDRPEDIFIETR